MRIQILTLVLCSGISVSNGQGGLEGILGSIEANNTEIKAKNQELESKRLMIKTGLNPANPTVGYDYLIGTPKRLGNQTDILVTQALDFPTAYFKRRKNSKSLLKQLEFESKVLRQNVLLEAKLTCLEIIHSNIHAAHLSIRLSNAQKMNAAVSAKYKNGQISAVVANKATLTLLNTKANLHLANSEKKQLLIKLVGLNGGVQLLIADTLYPDLPNASSLDSLQTEAISMSPGIQLHMQRVESSKSRIGLSRAMTLPKLETGYHYQTILGQTFSGVHLGISIPLWEGKNTVKYAKAYSNLADLQLLKTKSGEEYELKKLVEEYRALQGIVAQYEAVLPTIKSLELLELSLRLEHISFIEYAVEVDQYYNAVDQYLGIQKELHLAAAKLLKYKL